MSPTEALLADATMTFEAHPEESDPPVKDTLTEATNELKQLIRIQKGKNDNGSYSR